MTYRRLFVDDAGKSHRRDVETELRAQTYCAPGKGHHTKVNHADDFESVIVQYG